MRPPPNKRNILQPEERTYSSFEIMRALHIEKEKLRDWIDRGFIKAFKPSPGRGKPAAFRVKDIYGMALFMELLSHGFSREKASHMVENYHDSYDVEFPGDDESEPDIWILDNPPDFILFRRITDDQGNHIMNAEGVEGDDSDISLRTGKFFLRQHYKPRNDLPSNWDSVIVINYQKIRNAVNAALAKI